MMQADTGSVGYKAATQTPVWHVGRRGEVPGGMTQVVNGYLRWPFEKVAPGIIVSRDGTHGFRALGLFLRAAFQLITLRDAQRSVVVVHLSQGGSFVREGALLALASFRGAGTVAHLHGSSFVPFSRRRPALVRAVLSRAKRVIALSDATKAEVQRMVGADRVALVPNAVPGGQHVGKERLVVFGGAVSKRKGIDLLVQAWRAHCAGKGWRLVVAGPVLEADVVDRALPDAEFVGALSHEALMSLLDRSSHRRAALARRGHADVHSRGHGTPQLRCLHTCRGHSRGAR